MPRGDKIQGLPERIRQARLATCMKQWQLAKQCGWTASIISNFETGQREPSISSLRTLCLNLGVSSDWILGIESSARDQDKSLKVKIRKIIEET